jgi:peptide/nickel transport system permease protein
MAQENTAAASALAQALEGDKTIHDAGAVIADVGRLSLWQLTQRRFLRSRLAVWSGIVLIVFYLLVLLAAFLSPYDYMQEGEDSILMAPQRLRCVDQEGRFHLRPFVYGTQTVLDREEFKWVHTVDTSQVYPLRFFTQGWEYKFLGLIPMKLHLFGVDEPGTYFAFGTDAMGRDLFSRVWFGARISLTIGLVGVALTVVLGSSLGTASGYFGGLVDTIMQRVIELLMSFPTVPLWAALAAALPPDWSTIKRYFAISLILSLVGWTGLARQVRAKVLAYREMDYTLAARAVGSSDRRIVFIHMLPNAMSHIIVVATLRVPGMILAETSLSFLGLGIRPPMTSWGVLLQDAQRLSVILQHPWLMIPGIFVIIAVLCFNFVGDGLRDAVDPYAI